MSVRILRRAGAGRPAGTTGQPNDLDPSFVERIRAKAAESSRILTAKAQGIVDEHERCLAQISDPRLKASTLRR